MGTIVVEAFITLDGVIQAPGGSDEDRADGFTRGGWQMDFDAAHDTANQGDAIVADWESRTEGLLLGHTTYRMWSGAWGVWSEDEPGLMGEFTRRFNRVTKYVAAHAEPELPWRNSQWLGDDVPSAVRAARDATDGELTVWGSSGLIPTLAAHDLVDEYRLAVYPIVIGTGKKLFPEGFAFSTFSRVGSQPLDSGVVVNTYRRAG
jgi:dihydrofolate reductase